MVTFKKLGQLGRFGNQLFQYAALRGLATKNNFKLLIPSNKKEFHGQEYLLKNLSIPRKFFSNNFFFKTLFFKKYKEQKAEEIDKNFFNLKDNTDLEGYFQSTFYFYHCIDLIKKELTPKKEFLEKAKEKFIKISEAHKGYKIISLHLRRGDNVDTSIKQNNKKLIYSYGEDLMDNNSFYGKYLKSAKSLYNGKKVKFLIFSGGGRVSDENSIEIDWCRKNLVGDEYIFNTPQKSFEDFCLISQCDANIISPASSFGWWAAFLNVKNNDVVAPLIYDPNIKDPPHRYMFYPNYWKLV